MSKEAALEFLRKVSEDAELQEKLVAFAAEQGYDFTVDELTDAELDTAAGGTDNLQFTMVSNVMKTKHDTAKNAINNVSLAASYLPARRPAGRLDSPERCGKDRSPG